MAELTPLSTPDARRLASAYGLSLASLRSHPGGSVNSNFELESAEGRRYFLRIYEEQGRTGAASEARLLRELAAGGVPVVPPLAPLGGVDIVEHAGKPVALFEFVAGAMRCQASVSPADTRALGEALATVHAQTPRLTPLSEGRFRLPDLYDRLDRVVESGNAELARAAEHIRERLDHYAPLRDPELPRGIIHGDLFRDNVLWNGRELAALIDFESASFGPFAYDLMVCVLSWCFADDFRVELVDGLLSGYASRRALDPRELAAMRTEAALCCLRFATTRITDFSLRAPPGQAPARDYRRFLARLERIEAGALDAALTRLGASSRRSG